MRFFLGTMLLYFYFHFTAFGQVRINEICASNSSIVANPLFKEYCDWIELYNYSSKECNLKNCYITDDPKNLKKHRFKDPVIVQPGAYVILWANNKDTINYIDFELDREGETIILCDSALQIIDSLTYPALKLNISYGRNLHDPAKMGYFSIPSPGKANTGTLYSGISKKPEFLTKAGFFKNEVLISMTANGSIRFTINGADPSVTSNLYSSPFKITKTTVIKAISIENSKIPSEVVTQTFFVNDSSTLPIVSISTNPPNLWDNTTGIYVAGTNGITGLCSNTPVNWNQDWERPAVFEFFNTEKKEVVNTGVGIKIFGGCSRTASQKSLAVFARNEYGTNYIDYPVLPCRNFNTYKTLVVRNHGNDFGNAIMRDAVIQKTVCKPLNIDYQEYQPVSVYLNGEYWGIQEIREKLNEHYIASNYNISSDVVDLMELIYPNTIGDTYQAKHGDAAYFNYLVRFMKTNDLAKQENYEYIKNQIDIEEYINYHIAQIYVDNTDWPGNNVKIWRNRTAGGKYRWIMFDTDFGMGLYNRSVSDNSLAAATSSTSTQWPNPAYSTFILRQLLRNNEFKNQFINSYLYHINTTFKPENFIAVTDSITALIQPEAARHHTRWGQNYSNWQREVNVIKTYAQNRPTYALQHLASYFSLGSVFTFTVLNENPNLGKILFNGMPFYGDTYNGSHLSGLPLTAEAVALPGNRFEGWYVSQTSYSDLIMRNDIWKYLDNGTDQGTAWRDTGYNDSSWKSGKGILGYGGNGETTLIFSGPSTTKYITYYFRKIITIEDTSLINEMMGSVCYDDGVIIYINGQKVTSFNMPEGEITYTTLALTGIGGEDETRYNDFKIDKKFLRNGTNLVAVELHQYSAASSDVSFDMTLKAKKKIEILNKIETPKIIIKPDDKKIYHARFEKSYPLMLTEIYASPLSKKNYEFIEFYNYSADTIKIDSLIAGGDIHFIFPSNTIILPNEFFILTADKSKYTSAKAFQWTNGSLGLSGNIKLVDKKGNQIDSVGYSNSSPWPGKDEASLFSVELTDFTIDNILGNNWHLSSKQGGTPGMKNSVPVKPVIVRINEVMASNQMFYGDEKGKYPDLIELYNASEIPVNIGGYILTDDTTLKSYSRIPDTNPAITTIPPKGFLVFWADGDTSSGVLHVNFKINKTNEIIRLLDKDLNVLDQFLIHNLLSGQSVYRYPDGGIKTGVTSNPTPGFKNLMINSQPVFVSVPPSYALVDVPYKYLIKVSDPDTSDKITINGLLPTWLNLTDNGDGTATLIGIPNSTGNYYVKLTAIENNTTQVTQSFNITVNKLITVNDFQLSKNINIYPNPGNGLFTISLNGYKNGNIEISVLDLTGRMIFSSSFSDSDKYALDLTGQSKGIYILKINSINGSDQRKLIIN